MEAEKKRKRGKGENSRIVIDLNLGKSADDFGTEAKGQVPVVVAAAATDSLEFLDARHDHINHLGQKAPHVFPSQLARHRRRVTLA